jgi:hypothetical protein
MRKICTSGSTRGGAPSGSLLLYYAGKPRAWFEKGLMETGRR